MEIRPAVKQDLDGLIEIDGTIESSQYLHVERAGEGWAMSWKLEERPLRSKLISRNPPSDEPTFLLKQIVTGVEEGVVRVGEHEGALVALLVALVQPQFDTLRIIDLRVDFDFRRQGIGTALGFSAISEARERGLRAVTAETFTNNLPAARFLSKLGFDLAGLDARRHSNHDLVKEAVTLFWYAALD